MAIRDLLWACPKCRAPGSIRPAGRRERCSKCAAEIYRGPGASIVVEGDGQSETRSAGDWFRSLGPLPQYRPDANGHILGPDAVTVKGTNGQNAYRWKRVLLGWIETYDGARRGEVTLHADGLHFNATSGHPEHWTFDTITGVQPASSAIQITLRDRMISMKFLEASVRLWTEAIAGAIIEYHRQRGQDVFEFNPHVRTRPIAGTQPLDGPETLDGSRHLDKQ